MLLAVEAVAASQRLQLQHLSSREEAEEAERLYV
jgi:hypothetical protein